MSDVSIIGSGNMASAIGALALKGGNAVEIVGRDAAKTAALARALGDGATAGTWGAAPAGDIVILAVLFDSAVPVVSHYGDALDGKIIVDITNPFNPSVTGLAVPDDTSIAQMVAAAAPRSAHVVKAFNTLFRDVLAAGGPLDVFIAGDDAQAKASLSAFIRSRTAPAEHRRPEHAALAGGRGPAVSRPGPLWRGGLELLSWREPRPRLGY
jgi:predicted dinucleotide-binding enzyme